MESRNGAARKPKRRAKGGVIKARARELELTQDDVTKRAGCIKKHVEKAYRSELVFVESLEYICEVLEFDSIDEISDPADQETDFKSEIFESAKEFLDTSAEAKSFLTRISGEREDTRNNDIVKAILGGADPLATFWKVVMGGIRGSVRSSLGAPEREVTRHFRDLATMLVLPPEHATQIIETLKTEENRINASVTDEDVVVLHLAQALQLFNRPASCLESPGKITERTEEQLIPTSDGRIIHRLGEPPEGGDSSRSTQYRDDFITGLAWHLEIPSSTRDIPKEINNKLSEYAGLKSFPIRVAVFFSESRSSDVDELKKQFRKLLFVALPKENDPGYDRIIGRRRDIDARLR